jgi:hypothetical protein
MPPPSSDTPSGPGGAPGGSGTVHVACQADVVVVRVEGHLDGRAGHALEQAAAGLGHGAQRLDVDLTRVASYTAEGVAALLVCRDLSAGLAGGLHYRTGRGPGRDALLAAYGGAPGPED